MAFQLSQVKVACLFAEIAIENSHTSELTIEYIFILCNWQYRISQWLKGRQTLAIETVFWYPNSSISDITNSSAKVQVQSKDNQALEGNLADLVMRLLLVPDFTFFFILKPLGMS